MFPSNPVPEFFTPPNGMLRSRTSQQLAHTVPTCQRNQVRDIQGGVSYKNPVTCTKDSYQIIFHSKVVFSICGWIDFEIPGIHVRKLETHTKSPRNQQLSELLYQFKWQFCCWWNYRSDSDWQTDTWIYMFSQWTEPNNVQNIIAERNSISFPLTLFNQHFFLWWLSHFAFFT